jgi:hypothetical protein
MDDVSIELMSDDSDPHAYRGRSVEVGGHVHELTFDKRFNLGDEVDKENLTAKLESGVLTGTAPKVEVETGDREKVRKIPLTSCDDAIVQK